MIVLCLIYFVIGFLGAVLTFYLVFYMILLFLFVVLDCGRGFGLAFLCCCILIWCCESFVGLFALICCAIVLLRLNYLLFCLLFGFKCVFVYVGFDVDRYSVEFALIWWVLSLGCFVDELFWLDCCMEICVWLWILGYFNSSDLSFLCFMFLLLNYVHLLAYLNYMLCMLALFTYFDCLEIVWVWMFCFEYNQGCYTGLGMACIVRCKFVDLLLMHFSVLGLYFWCDGILCVCLLF